MAPGDFGDVGFGPPPLFQLFIVLALLWAGVPLVIAAVVASSRGESVATAVVLTLTLGWAGLAIVLFGQHRTARDTGALLRKAGPPAAPAGDVAKRLEALDALHEQGLVSDEERAQRRTAILEEL